MPTRAIARKRRQSMPAVTATRAPPENVAPLLLETTHATAWEATTPTWIAPMYTVSRAK